jgi:putative intracellular protease/amidase
MSEKRKFGLIIVMFLSLASLGLAAVEVNQDSTAKVYICPPCGCSSDDRTFDKAGYCNACSMELVEKNANSSPTPTPNPTPNRKKAAILIFDGVQIIDYAGPYEVFGQAGLEVFTVAANRSMITTAMGMKVTPNHTLDDSPVADVLIIPGGGVDATQDDPQVIKWIQERSKSAEHVLSVCNGAYILARTGLLDGLTATTFYGLLDGLAAAAPKVKVVRDQRYVDNGKFITTAGLSSGIDGSLFVVSKMFGKARAQMVALNMEYDWKPGSTYARASFADLQIRQAFGPGLRLIVPEGTEARVMNTAGNTRLWEVNWQVEGETSAADIQKAFSSRLIDRQWKRQDADSKDATRSLWKFNDESGSTWNGTAEVQPAGDKKFTVSLKVERRDI